MKTIYLISFYYGDVKAGPVIRFRRYYPFLIDQGYQIVFLTKRRNDEDEVQTDETGIESIHFECSSAEELTKLALKYVDSKDESHLVILFYVSYRNYFDFKRSKKAGHSLLYVSTMQLTLTNKAVTRLFLKRWLLIWLLRRVYSLMNRIVTSTPTLAQEFKEIGIRSEKLLSIFNGVNTTQFAPVIQSKKESLRKELGISRDQFVFVYVGLFVERKGVDQLLNTFKEVVKTNDNTILLLVGGEKDNMENSARFRRDWPNLKAEALEAGWLKVYPFSDQVNTYFQLADSFVFMSKLEGMPNVLLEAMSSGLPILTTRFEGFSDDYGVDGQHFIHFTDDFNHNVEMVSRLITSEDLREQLKENAVQLIQEKFSLQTSIGKYTDLFNELGC